MLYGRRIPPPAPGGKGLHLVRLPYNSPNERNSGANMDSSTQRAQFGLQLVIVARRFRRVMDSALAEHGLTDATALPLRYLAWLDAGIRQKELAERLDIEAPSLVQVLDQLGAMGLVERREDPQDRRAKIVCVTEKGRALHAAFAGKLAALREGIFAGTGADDIAAGLRLLARIEANLLDPDLPTGGAA